MREFLRLFLIAALVAMRAEVKDLLGAAMEAAGTLTNLAGGAEQWFKTNATGWSFQEADSRRMPN